ncbi:MAG: ferritin family protein [Verrucomicrobiota bacterium]
MATKFTADEILEMAERIETKGAKFYRKAAKLHVGARDLLLQIAAQEDLHFKAFEDMRKGLSPSEKESAYDPYGESDLYLKAMVDGYAFDINREPAEAITGKEPLDEVFRMAIELEKDSIVFYLGLRDVVPPSFGKERVNDIVKEEMKHIAWLSNKRAEAKAGSR